MRSLRTKITLMTVCVILFTLTAVMLFSVIFIRTNEHHKSEQLLLLLCETGERNLDYYFNSVQRSVRKVESFVTADLDGLEERQLQRHMERVRKYFDEMASKTNGVLTYYYRIDPAYGTMADMENLISEAGSRGIRIVMDLVFNHQSSSGDDAAPLVRRIESLHGTHTVEYAARLGLGSQQYTLIDLDEQTGVSSAAAPTLRYNVYTLDGRKLLTNATSLDGLAKGAYIVNGEKRMIE